MKSEIIHFEIPARNPAKLSKFYGSCFGWKFTDAKMTGMKYWMINTSPGNKKALAGGMYKRDNSDKGPRNYINTQNIDSSIRKVKSAGGRILMGKQEIPMVGWSAITTDPEGNVVGLFQPFTTQQRKAAAKKSRR